MENMENTQSQSSQSQSQIQSAKQNPGPGVLVAGVGAFLVVMMFIFGGCFGRGGNDRTVVEYEQTNRDLIHQAGVTAGVNAIMGK